MTEWVRKTCMWLVVAAGSASVSLGSGCGAKTPAPGGPEATGSPCALPTTMASSNEQTAWQLFVAASCSAGGKLAWEGWTEQSCFLQPGTPGCAPGEKAAASHRLHDSKLRRGLKRAAAAAAPVVDVTPGPCSPMTNTKSTPPPDPSLVPFIPNNLSPAPTFCEEVFVNPPEAAFVQAPAAGQSLTTLTAQVAYVATTAIQFPVPSVEIKADWLPAASVNNAFDCAGNRPAGVYVETIDGACYALVGMHISSKLLPNWLWSTFEPQNKITNPNRCNPDLYNSCNDAWGSNPATSTGQSTQPTEALAALIARAELPKEFLNYRLVAAQSTYVDANNNPIQLGNSFVEFNAQVPVHQASCITCHSYAMVSKSTSGAIAENPNFGAFPNTPPIGTPGNPPPVQGGGSWYPQDFSWMLGIMPTTPPNR